MRLLRDLWRVLTGQASVKPVEEPTGGPVPAAVPQPRLSAEPVDPAEPTRRGRPVSTSLSRTVDLLKRKPEITPAQLAKELSVTAAYARTLLRRARSKVPEIPPPAPVAVPRESTVLHPVVADLNARLSEAEKSLSALRAATPQSRGSWNFNRRAEVLRLADGGTSASDIAARLCIPAGEVEFILKVHRVLESTR